VERVGVRLNNYALRIKFSLQSEVRQKFPASRRYREDGAGAPLTGLTSKFN
jgi:hypothetical protein